MIKLNKYQLYLYWCYGLLFILLAILIQSTTILIYEVFRYNTILMDYISIEAKETMIILVIFDISIVILILLIISIWFLCKNYRLVIFQRKGDYDN